MNEYNFDPLTGEPIQKEPAPENHLPPQEPPVAEPEAVAPQEAGQEEKPFQGEVQSPTEPSGWRAEYIPHPLPPQKVKKEPKPVTRKGMLLFGAATLILSLLLGIGGGIAAMRWIPAESTLSGTAVIYKTAKLEDEEGNRQEKELTTPQVAELVKNSVVEITTEQIVTGSFMQQYVSEGAGSGVIFTKDGYIVTNHHVIDGATNINVRLADGKEYKAKLIGSDAKSDLAVIKVEAADLSPAAFGQSGDLKVGDTVVAVGNPLGKLGGTVTRGIISALDRAITIDNVTMNLLQTDTAINPGNSGGGMFNTHGQLVGVVNAKSAGEEIEGLGFAIPIDTAAAVIEDLIENGYVTGRVNPGFTFLEINDSMTAMMYRVSKMGLYISGVEAGSDSQKAGFMSGDYVVSVDGQSVTTEAQANAIIDAKKVGESVTVVVERGMERKTITMVLSEYTPKKGSAQANGNVPMVRQ